MGFAVAEIIATVFAESPGQAQRTAARAAMAGADWIELRLDAWPLHVDLRALIRGIGLPVIATCRTPREGGTYRGELAARRELLQRALSGGAHGVDLEDWEEWQPAPRPRLVIRSHHNLVDVGQDLAARRDALLAQGADVAKLAVTAPDLADAAPVLQLLAATEQTKTPTIAFAMGRAAALSRVLSCVLGAPYVYATADPGAGVDGEASAIVPSQQSAQQLGQLPVDSVRGIYGVHNLSSQSLLFGLLGQPVNHSLGPWLHNRVFRHLGIDAVYLPLETARPDALVASLPRRRLRGLSVTAPFKESIARGCHLLDDAAQATGAVNTVLFDAHGQVRGCNTDVHGVRAALAEAGLSTAPRKGTSAAVLGSGGGARAAAVVLQDMGFAVTLLARSLDRVRAFARGRGLQLASLRADLLAQMNPLVVVHATPVGTVGTPQAGERLLPEWAPARGTFVLDMVYRPAITPLLVAARAHDAIPVSGLAMFLAQAREQVRLFTGQEVDTAVLRGFLAGVL